MKILTPVIFIINKLANRICKLFGVDPNADTQKMTEEEPAHNRGCQQGIRRHRV